MGDLSGYSTAELAAELAHRRILHYPGGQMIANEVEMLRTKLGPLAHIDGVPLRRVDGRLEVMGIRHRIGDQARRITMVGGSIYLGQSMHDVLHDHFSAAFRCTFGTLVPWNRPTLVLQYGPAVQYGSTQPRRDFHLDPGKHVISPVFPVTLVGTPSRSGPNAPEVVWMTAEKIVTIGPDGFGRNHDRAFGAVLVNCAHLV